MKLMVLDGNSIINRSFYGIRPLTTRDGLYTHAVYGFLTTLQRLLDEEKPEGLCVTFDRREPTFRHEADADYKATRHAMPEELAVQMPVLKQVLDAMDIPRYELVGFEADDLIGTISRRCEAAGWDCVIVTGDKDSLQLVTEHTKVKLVSTRMGQTTTKDMTPGTFREQYGFDPIHMIDLKALMGDTSDNIPGVPGVGEKTAMALVQRYGSIDEIYRLLPDIEAKPAAIRKLQAGEDAARHSYWLATIVTDAPLAFDPAENVRRPFRPELYDLLLKLEFQKLIDRYGLRPAAQTEEKPDCTATAEELLTAAQAEEFHLLVFTFLGGHFSDLSLKGFTLGLQILGLLFKLRLLGAELRLQLLLGGLGCVAVHSNGLGVEHADFHVGESGTRHQQTSHKSEGQYSEHILLLGCTDTSGNPARRSKWIAFNA